VLCYWINVVSAGYNRFALSKNWVVQPTLLYHANIAVSWVCKVIMGVMEKKFLH